MNIRNFALPALALMTITALVPMTAQAQDINKRREDQHARIQQGVKSGQLTHHEAASLRARQYNIHTRELRDRLAHGGHLTKAERARLNRSLNSTNHTIYRDKHNDRVR